MEETGLQFETYEYGLASFLFKVRNYEMIAILKTCTSIEVLIKLLKNLKLLILTSLL